MANIGKLEIWLLRPYPAENKIINARRAARDAFKPQYAVENTQKGTAAGETIFAGNKGASADHDMTFFGIGNSPFREAK